MADDLREGQHPVEIVQILIQFFTDPRQWLRDAADCRGDLFLPLLMMGNQLSGTGAGVGDRPPVSRVRHLAVEEQHPPQRLEVLGEGGDALPVRQELYDRVWTDP